MSVKEALWDESVIGSFVEATDPMVIDCDVLFPRDAEREEHNVLKQRVLQYETQIEAGELGDDYLEPIKVYTSVCCSLVAGSTPRAAHRRRRRAVFRLVHANACAWCASSMLPSLCFHSMCTTPL